MMSTFMSLFLLFVLAFLLGCAIYLALKYPE